MGVEAEYIFVALAITSVYKTFLQSSGDGGSDDGGKWEDNRWSE